ncbi:hypothetical protein EYR40_002360 [Pleurotus pulmonarius]|nr:hypothetical protein EYR40_002360 [Pleurotus pulmonarius]
MHPSLFNMSTAELYRHVLLTLTSSSISDLCELSQYFESCHSFPLICHSDASELSGDSSYHHCSANLMTARDEDVWENLYRAYTADLGLKTHFYYPTGLSDLSKPSSPGSEATASDSSILAVLRSESSSTLSPTMTLLNGAPPSPPCLASPLARGLESTGTLPSLSPIFTSEASPFEKPFEGSLPVRDWSRSVSLVSPVIRAAPLPPSPCASAPSRISTPSQKVNEHNSQPLQSSATTSDSPEIPLRDLFSLTKRIPNSVISPLLQYSTPTRKEFDASTSPLTPISEIPGSSGSSNGNKRKATWPVSPTPPPRKRLTRSNNKENIPPYSTPPATVLYASPASEPQTPPVHSPIPNDPDTHPQRTLPQNIEISSKFPLFYRRFPASSYFNTDPLDNNTAVFKKSHPGGIYNPPRDAFDLYTPRFVKGKGREKVGMCPVCVEDPVRGGEGKRVWLSMKFSALKYYHMQYAHGISAMSGRPFSPPVALRTIVRQSPGKKEKPTLQQGKCHKCRKWVPVEGVRETDLKVKEIMWWKHAAACHQGGNLEGEGDVFVEDEVFRQLSLL